MRITHLVGGSMSGGAAKAALAIHEALCAEGIDSTLVQSHGNAVSNAGTLETGVVGQMKRYGRTVADRTIGQTLMVGGDGRRVTPGLFGAPIHNHGHKSDVLHLHWIGDGGFRLPHFGALNPATVWTLQDQWALTGGCHYSFDCTRYEDGCNSDCPVIGRGAVFASVLQRRNARSVRKGIYAVAVSSWIAQTAERSRVFAGQTVRTIPNCVDTDAFWPVPTSVARQALGLPIDRPILLIGHASSSIIKGADLLADAIDQIEAVPDGLDLVGFGGVDDTLADRYTRHFGRVHDIPTLRLLFSAADVFALPSRAEAFGRTVIEAFACGTPVVAFAGTGPDDIITSGTGRLVPAFNTAAFADALLSVAMESAAYAEPCRQRAVDHFAHCIIARQYIALYEEILANRA